MRSTDPTAAISLLVLWLLSLVAVAVVLTGLGAVAVPFGIAVSLLALGGVLLLGVRSFVGYFAGEHDRLF